MTTRLMGLAGIIFLLVVPNVFAEAEVQAESSLSGRYRLGSYLTSSGEYTPDKSTGYVISETANNTLLVKFVEYGQDNDVISELEAKELSLSPTGGYSFFDGLEGVVTIQPNAEGQLVSTWEPTCACYGQQIVQKLEKLDFDPD